MLTNDLDHLLIFSRGIRPNARLKKFKSQSEKVQNNIMVAEYDIMTDPSRMRGKYVWDGINFPVPNFTPLNSSHLKRKFYEMYIKIRCNFQRKPEQTFEDFFATLKDTFKTFSDEHIYDDSELINLIKKCEDTAQTFEASRLSKIKGIIEFEKILKDNGFDKYQTEEDIVKFIKKTERGLCISELEFFQHVIPNDVYELFKKAEDLLVFDNYYILHFDTKESKNPFYIKAKCEPKDPILFGGINGSNKLYFIADWIDEYCNLTYSDILKTNQNTIL